MCVVPGRSVEKYSIGSVRYIKYIHMYVYTHTHTHTHTHTYVYIHTYSLRPQVFYGTAFDGVILVYDLANSVSRRNLEKWRNEWKSAYFGGGAGVLGGGHHSSGGGGGGGNWGD